MSREDSFMSAQCRAGPPRAISDPEGLDMEDFREDLAESDLTDEQAKALLGALWHIMSIFVDIGWGVDSVQHFLPEVFGKAHDSGSLLPPDPGHGIEESCPDNGTQEERT